MSPIAAVSTTLKVFIYDVVWTENQTHHIPKAKQMRYISGHISGLQFEADSAIIVIYL